MPDSKYHRTKHSIVQLDLADGLQWLREIDRIQNILYAYSNRNTNIILEYRDDELWLRISDGGQGVDVSKITDVEDSGRGRGVLSMKERVALLGGTCSIESQLGKGQQSQVCE
jgi:signal transduction histidine kinase